MYSVWSSLHGAWNYCACSNPRSAFSFQRSCILRCSDKPANQLNFRFPTALKCSVISVKHLRFWHQETARTKSFLQHTNLKTDHSFVQKFTLDICLIRGTFNVLCLQKMDILRLQFLIVAATIACEDKGKEIIHHYHHYDMIWYDMLAKWWGCKRKINTNH